MTKTRSASWTLIKVGFAFPAFFAVLLLFTAGTSATLSAQETQQKTKQSQEQKNMTTAKPAEEETVFEVVETMPSFPGGFEALINYMVTNVKYPEEAKKNGIQGKVFVSFIVEKDGSISHVKIVQGIGSGCDEEAARVIKAMPDWIPGKNQENKTVRVQFNLPIVFSLDNKNVKTESEGK
jgi:TonB family protein